LARLRRTKSYVVLPAFRPGAMPLERLLTQFARAHAAGDDLRLPAVHNLASAFDVVRRALTTANKGDGATLVIAIDQGEELVHRVSTAAASEFWRCLAALQCDDKLGVVVL